MTELAPAITAQRIPDEGRLNFLPRHFHRWCLAVERAVFRHLGNLCPRYAGGTWTFYDLSNGGCYLTPPPGDHAIAAANGFAATVDVDTAGIIASLYALSQLAFEFPTKDIFATRFHELRAFALEHPRAREICAAID